MRRFVFALAAAMLFAAAALSGQNRKAEDECGAIRRPEVSLVGSRQALCWANWRADLEGILQVRSAEERRRLINAGELLNLALVPHLRVNPHQLREDEPGKRHLYGWALERLAKLAADYYAAFGKELLLNSAHRTEEEQLALLARERVILGGRPRLVPVNSNAADVWGPRASLHLRPITVDIARTDGIPGSLKPISRSEDRALARWLLEGERKDCLEATLESVQAVYHVTFYKACGAGLKAAASLRKERRGEGK